MREQTSAPTNKRESHFCASCGHEFGEIPAVDESCPVCGSDEREARPPSKTASYVSDGGTGTVRRVVLTPWAYVGYVSLAFLGGMLLAALIIGTAAGKVGL